MQMHENLRPVLYDLFIEPMCTGKVSNHLAIILGFLQIPARTLWSVQPVLG